MNTAIFSTSTTDIIPMIIVFITLLYTFYQIHKKIPFMLTNFILYLIPTQAIILAIKLWIINNMNIWIISIIMIAGILGAYYLTLRKHRKDIENDEEINKDLEKFSLMTKEEQKEALIKFYEERELIIKKGKIISDKSLQLIASLGIIFGIWGIVPRFLNVHQLTLDIVAIFGLLTICIVYIIDLTLSIKRINKKINHIKNENNRNRQ